MKNPRLGIVTREWLTVSILMFTVLVNLKRKITTIITRKINMIELCLKVHNYRYGVIIMLIAASHKHDVSNEGKLEFASIVKMCAGPAMADISLSQYSMDQCFSPQKEHITYHFYCITCFDQVLYSVKAGTKMNNQFITCTNCLKKKHMK